jgi:hypothetical protein
LRREFDGSLVKVARAAALLTEFENLAAAALTDCTVVSENQLNKSRYAFWVEGPPISPQLSILAGEILHHLRSALDHVVWAIAKHPVSGPNTRLQFPVMDTPKKYRDAWKTDTLKGVPEKYRDVIESVQPYKSDPIENSVLAVIHKLDIIDKHRLLLLAVTAMRHDVEIRVASSKQPISIHLPPADNGSPFHKAIEDGHEVQWVSYSPPCDGVVIENDFTVSLTLRELSHVGTNLGESLRICLEFVAGYLHHFSTVIDAAEQQEN